MQDKKIGPAISVQSIGLPKWPQMFVWGTPVTPDQAKDIIFRTDRFLTSMSQFGGGNNHSWNEWAWECLGIKDLIMDESQGNWRYKVKVLEARSKEMGHIPTEYISNDWASCSFMGGPHGWCHPDGTLGYNDNVGKYPDAEDLLADWTALAYAFPYLDLTATFMSGEASEGDSKPVFSVRVKDGTAVAIAAVKPPRLAKKSVSVIDQFIQNLGDERLEQGLPDSWIIELGKRSRMALAHIIPSIKNEAEAPATL
jgi:hypothetical protein